MFSSIDSEIAGLSEIGPLDDWLAIAVQGLCVEARERVSAEVRRHVEEAVQELCAEGMTAREAVAEAVNGLGSARRANRAFCRANFTDADEFMLAHATHFAWVKAAQSQPRYRQSLIISSPFLFCSLVVLATAWAAGSKALLAVGLGILVPVPMVFMLAASDTVQHKIDSLLGLRGGLLVYGLWSLAWVSLCAGWFAYEYIHDEYDWFAIGWALLVLPFACSRLGLWRRLSRVSLPERLARLHDPGMRKLD